jgi:uncharacterized protein (UPF0303 family)
MAGSEDLEIVRLQEAELIFPEFTELTAFAIGTMIQPKGVAEGWPIAVEIRRWDRPLFHAALPGSSLLNFDWVRRKVWTVQRFAKSSYRVLLERNGERILPPQWALAAGEYALAGGAFPIRARGFGVIGAASVSGLEERMDHMAVVEAFAGHLGKDMAALRLPE